MAKSIFLVSVSNLVANSVTFFLMMVAGRFLTVSDFAFLSLTVSLTYLFSTVLDFGASFASVRAFRRNPDKELLDGLMSLKWFTLLVIAPISLLAIRLSSGNGAVAFSASFALLGSTFVNVWMGCRAIEQAREAFVRYAVNNLLYACSRLLLGCTAVAMMLSGEFFYAVAFVLPTIAFVGIQAIVGKAYKISLRSCLEMLKSALEYSSLVFVSSASYVALLYVPQILIAYRLPDAAVATYGLALTFLGVVSLVANSTRTVLLPRVMRDLDGTALKELRGGLKSILPKYLGASTVVLIVGAVLIDHIYGDVFPDADEVFAICGAGLLVTVYVGFYNMSLHALGRPGIEAICNVCRLLVLIVALYYLGYTLIGIASVFALVLMLGEFATAIIVTHQLRAWR